MEWAWAIYTIKKELVNILVLKNENTSKDRKYYLRIYTILQSLPHHVLFIDRDYGHSSAY